MATSNNAVCEAFINGNAYVFSFGGIDSSKIYSGIHKRSFKYDVQGDSWSEIASLPDTLGKIASASSFVNGKIYIMGGYHVFSNGNEISSDRVHVYDPVNNLYLNDASPIPVAIDDHVQCVYKDSLIYVITGWSQTSNVSNVQIYDVFNDSWSVGTPVPNNAFYKTFGASGEIIGDTIYYHGGAAGFNFAARTYLRKGVIDPNDPTNITWLPQENAPGLAGYRSACGVKGNTVFWVGGSSVSYNYNGISYSGGAGVNPSARILHWNQYTDGYADMDSQPYGVMDLRGIADIGNGNWIICGGMDSNQVVRNRTFLLQNNLVNLHKSEFSRITLKDLGTEFLVEYELPQAACLLDAMGRVVVNFPKSNKITIPKSNLKPGIYYLRLAKETLKLMNNGKG